MTEIKSSLERIRTASQQLEHLQKPDGFNAPITSIKEVLSDLNDSLEELKSGVLQTENSPIKYNR